MKNYLPTVNKQVKEYGSNRHPARRFVYALFLFALLTLLASSKNTWAQEGAQQVDGAVILDYRLVDIGDADIQNPTAIAYSFDAGIFFYLQPSAQNQYEIFSVTPFENVIQRITVDVGAPGPVRMAFDSVGERLLLLPSNSIELLEIPTAWDGSLLPDAEPIRHTLSNLTLSGVQGITVDAVSGHLYILGGATQTIVELAPDAESNFSAATIVGTITPAVPAGVSLRGLSRNDATGVFYALGASGDAAYEFDASGQLQQTYLLVDVGLTNPQALVLANTADNTDDPDALDLFVVDAAVDQSSDPETPPPSDTPDQNGTQLFFPLITGEGTGNAIAAITATTTTTGEVSSGRVFELFLAPRGVAVASATTIVASLVRTTNTSQYTPPSPDPSGISYMSHSNTLFIGDGEVDEMTIFAGKNLWETTLAGAVVGSYSSIVTSDNPRNDEPVGVAYAPPGTYCTNPTLFISDDTSGSWIDVVDLGADGKYGTADDIRTKFSTSNVGSGDPEGLAYDSWNNAIFISDGTGEEVYRVPAAVLDPGSNVRCNHDTSDDQVTHFDVTSLGIRDPEGIEFNPDTGRLYILSHTRGPIAELLLDGTLVQYIDVTATNGVAVAGLAYGPSSTDPAQKHLYIVDRGVDNNQNANENDGKLYELSFPSANNATPAVDAGPDQNITLAGSAALVGTVTDDGNPNPPGAVTTTWSKFSGPGNVTFANANSRTTNATFSAIGTYVLRLTASDSQLSASDDVTVIVTGSSGQTVIQRRVAASADDAEENGVDGTVSVTNSDLEMVFDGGGNQTVGMRFNAMDIPRGATILNAYVQFKVDETPSGATNLTIQGQAADNAPIFTTANLNISSRPRTNAAINWQPAPWPTVGEIGPAQQTPDIAPVIQEIVNRGGWNSGNSIVIIVTGTGERVAEAWNGDQAGAPLLTVTYGTAPSNQPPVVDAGQDKSIVLPANSVQLDGTVSDDGIPNGTLTTQWSVVSGPGSVTFGDPNQVDTSASFSTAGTYELRLTANDSALTTNDSVMVNVMQNPNPPNQAPSVSAGPDRSVTLAAGAALDGTVSDDGLPNPPGSLTTSWSMVSGPGTVTFGNANAVDTTASFSAAGSYVLRLTASDSALQTSDDVAVTVSSSGGDQQLQRRVSASADDAEESSANGSVSINNGDLELVFDTSNQVVGIRFNSISIPTGATILNASVQFKVDQATSSATNLTIQGQAADNAPAFTTASLNISSRPKTAAAVNWQPAPWPTVGEIGVAQQTPNIASVLQEIVNRPSWSSGNSVVIIITGTGRRIAESWNGDQAGAPLLTVTYSTSGGNQNQAPNVSAGLDQSVTLAAGATLDGTVSDDGQPASLITSWSKVSGSGTVTFGNANAVDTTASFSAAGAYVLRLTASDSALQTSDDVNITVTTGGGGPLVLDSRVSASADDAEESSTGVVDVASSDLELVFDATNQVVGMRFSSINIPRGAVIANAYVQFKVDETHTPATNLTIQGQAADNATTFTTAAQNVSSRPRTTAAINWQPPLWPTVGQAGVDQRTPNIAAVIQEILDRSGWSSGNSLAIIITGTGERVAEAWDGDQAGAPLLHIEYSLP
jgi:uncharacterized protein YjiK